MAPDLKPHFNFICDLKTSGSDPMRNGIIEFCLLVTDPNLNVIDQFYRRVCPPDLSPSTWDWGAFNVHGIPYEAVQGFMPNEQFCYELLCFLAKYKNENNQPQPFICHCSRNGKRKLNQNGKSAGGWDIIPWFDFFFLEWAMRKHKFADGSHFHYSLWKVINEKNLISTVEMGRAAGHRKNNLKAWAERIGFNLQHHEALSDTCCCLEVYKHLKSGKVAIDKIETATKTPKGTMIDGKYYTADNIPF